MSIRMKVWGDYACFTRPEMKSERVSYDILTPSAARGIVESIFWHPGMKWVIDAIYVQKPILFTNIRRNEVSEKISCNTVRSAAKSGKPLSLFTSQCIQQRATTALRNVEYIIEAHFDMTDQAAPGDNPGKFQEMFTRRLKKGQCYRQPVLGCREFSAFFSPCEEIPPCPPELKGTRDLGYLLYDLDYSDPANIRPLYFRAVLVDGKLDLREVEIKS